MFDDLFPVGQTVVVAVGIVRVGADLTFYVIGQAVTVSVGGACRTSRRAARVERIADAGRHGRRSRAVDTVDLFAV